MAAWQITGTLDPESFFDDHIRDVLTRERSPLPPREQRLGHVETRWEIVAPKRAFIQARGGTADDRLYAQLLIAEQLRPHGYRQATYDFDDEVFRRHATWDDVMSKAKRLIQSGAVKLLRNGYQNVVSQVQGDHGTYDTEIFRQDPDSRALTGSDCTCDWGEFQNQPRTRTWKRFQDRPCSHILATYWTSLGTPLDEDTNPGLGGGGAEVPAWGQQGQGQQMSLFQSQPQPGGGPGPAPGAPPAGLNPGQMALPGAIPGGAQGPAQQLPGPSPRDVLPQFPMEGQASGQINPASVPGGRGPTPTNPTQTPAGPGGTFSSWQFAWNLTGDVGDDSYTDDVSDQTPSFANGDIVQLRYDDTGTLVGRSEEHGAGQQTTVRGGQLGEVLGTDPSTGMVQVLYMGKPFDANGPMEPFGATAWSFPSYLIPRPDVKPPGPALRRS